MTSINRLDPGTLRALKDGRALVLLCDYRHPALPDHTFTAVGFLDTEGFEGTLIPDCDPDCDLARLEVPVGPNFVTATSLESADAKAVHALWSAWNTGVHADYMRFIELIAYLVGRERLGEAMQSTPTDARHGPRKRGRGPHRGRGKSGDPRGKKR